MHPPLLALLNKSKLRIQVEPLIIHRRLLSSGQYLVLNRDLKHLPRLGGLDKTLKLLEGSLVNSQPIRILPARNQINPPLMPLRQNMPRDITRILVSIADDRDNSIPAGDFVILEPIVKGLRDSRAEFLDILDRVHERSDGVAHVDHEDFPVGLAAVIRRYGAQNFGLSDLAKVAWVLPDVEEVDRVVVAGFVGEGVADVGVFPGLGDLVSPSAPFVFTVPGGVEWVDKSWRKESSTHRAVNKRITPMRPHALHKPRLVIPVIVEDRRQSLFALDLDLAICPAWNLNHSVDDGRVVLVRVEGNVVPEGDGVALVQQPNSPVESVAGADFAQTDGVVVEFAVVGAGVGAGGCVGVVAFAWRTGWFG
jgi:hypothetical protein